MSRDPLNYASPDPQKRRGVGFYFAMTAYACFSPTLVVPLIAFVLDPVHRRWLTGEEFNQFLGGAAFAAAAGILCGVGACFTQSRSHGVIAILLNLLGVLLLPSLFYA